MKTKALPSTSEIRRTFHKIYYKDIAPVMEKYEKKRQFEWLKIFIIEAILITLLIIGLKFFWSFLMSEKADQALFCLFVNLFFLGGIMGVPIVNNINFAKNLKKSCMNTVVTAFGDIQWYNIAVSQIVDSTINTDSQLRESELFSVYNRRADDDIFEGKFKDVKFTISETNLTYVSGSGKNRRVYPVFDGVIINFEANKTIRNKTIIATKNDSNIRNRNWSIFTVFSVLFCVAAGIIGKDFTLCLYGIVGIVILFSLMLNTYKLKKNKKYLNEIKLEDPEFNKKYKAYSSDEVEGRYLITPAFMERFKNLQTSFGARRTKCSFYGNSLMFAISTGKNLFEIGNLFTPLNSPKQLEKFFNELISILALIDYFKLDEKTGL